MRKRIVISFLAIAMLIPATALAADHQANPFSNAKAEFWATPAAPAGADGHAIINYVRGQDRWNVSGEVQNLAPNTLYTVHVGDTGTLANQMQVASFTTDGDGNGTFSANRVNLYDRTGGPEYTAVRVMHGGSPILAANFEDDRDPPQGSIDVRGEQRAPVSE